MIYRYFVQINLALVMLAGCASIPATPHIARVVVFGDSNVDNGNLYRLTGQKYPAAPRWQGRESDGPVVVEYLASNLHATLQDYAVSGATTGVSNIVEHKLTAAAGTGMMRQLDDFFQSGAQLKESDLVVIWAGSNDVFEVRREDRNALDTGIATATANLEKAVDRLAAQGAGHIIVANRSPRPAIGSDNDLNGTELNAAIDKTVRVLRETRHSDIKLYDDYAAISDMVKNPSRYGFSEVNELCIKVPACAEQNVDTNMTIADTYINWDGAHKTTRVHRLMADQIQQLLVK